MNSYNRYSKLTPDVDLSETVDPWVSIDFDRAEKVYTVEQGTTLEDVRIAMNERELGHSPEYFIRLENGRMFRVVAAAKLEEIDQEEFDDRYC